MTDFIHLSNTILHFNHLSMILQNFDALQYGLQSNCLANEMNTTTGQHFKVTKQAETEHYKWIGSTKIAFLM